MSVDGKGTVGTTIQVNGKDVPLVVQFNGVDGNDLDISNAERDVALATLNGAVQAMQAVAPGLEIQIQPGADVFIMEGNLSGGDLAAPVRSGGATAHLTGEQFGQQFGIRLFGKPPTPPAPQPTPTPPATTPPAESPPAPVQQMTITRRGNDKKLDDDVPLTYVLTPDPQNPQVTEEGQTYDVYTYQAADRTRTVRRLHVAEGADPGPWLFNNYASDAYAGTWAPWGTPPPSSIGGYTRRGAEGGFDVYLQEKGGAGKLYRTADGFWFRKTAEGSYQPVKEPASSPSGHPKKPKKVLHHNGAGAREIL